MDLRDRCGNSSNNRISNANSNRTCSGNSSRTCNGNSKTSGGNNRTSRSLHPRQSGRVDLPVSKGNSSSKRISSGNNSSNNRISNDSSRTYNGNNNSNNSKTSGGNSRTSRSLRQSRGRAYPRCGNNRRWHARPRNSLSPRPATDSSARTEGSKRVLQAKMTRNRNR